MKCATVAIIGRPSVGKSTLLNTICETKISITASTPQTTRNAIRGIYTDSRGQLIFTDTPGFHLSEKKMNIKLKETAVSSLEESDIILYLVDASRAQGEEEAAIADIIAKANRPVLLCINKQDILTDLQRAEAKAFAVNHVPEATILAVSGKKDQGVDELLIALFSLASDGPLLYPEDAYTDQPLEFRISEIIREKAINSVTDEIPHAIYVDIADIEQKEDGKVVWIRAFIVVERESQKGIVVGKGGANIKKIRKASFGEIKRIFPGRTLQLDLRVKAQDKWRRNSIVLDRILD